MKNYVNFEMSIFGKSSSRHEDDPNDIGFYSCYNFKGNEFEFSYNVKKGILRKIVSSAEFKNDVKSLIDKYISLREGQKENDTHH